MAARAWCITGAASAAAVASKGAHGDAPGSHRGVFNGPFGFLPRSWPGSDEQLSVTGRGERLRHVLLPAIVSRSLLATRGCRTGCARLPEPQGWSAALPARGHQRDLIRRRRDAHDEALVPFEGRYLQPACTFQLSASSVTSDLGHARRIHQPHCGRALARASCRPFRIPPAGWRNCTGCGLQQTIRITAIEPFIGTDNPGYLLTGTGSRAALRRHDEKSAVMMLAWKAQRIR
jgi:hypothetical protein